MNRDDDIFEIINGKQCLRDGARLRVRTTLMDGDSGPARVTDSFGRGGLALHRPGFRVLDDDEIGARVKEQAYRQYETALCDSYKGDVAPAGAYPYTAAAEGSACTINGRAGMLVRQGNVLVCEPTKLDADLGAYEFEDADEGENDDEERSSRRRRRRWTERDPAGRERGSLTEEDSRGVAQRMRDHQANMERIYQDRDYELTQAWRNPR